MPSTNTQDTPKKARRRTPAEPSPQYLEVLAILERGDMPTPQQYYDLMIHDPIMAWVHGRISDEISYYYNKYGSLPERRSQNDAFVRACEAIRAAWRAEWDARHRAWQAQQEAESLARLAERKRRLAEKQRRNTRRR